MGINARAKGSRIEKKCIDEITSLGYLVDRVEKKGKFLKAKDLFGLFDIVCIKRGEVIFVQVTCNKQHTHTLYQDFSRTYHNNSLKIQQWIYYDHKGWVVFDYVLGTKLKRDMRKR